MGAELREDPRGPLRVWRRPSDGRRYVVGADTGGGRSSSDWCAAAVIDAQTREDVAAFRAHLSAEEFADAVWALSKWYAGRDEDYALVVPEANNHGLAMMNRLRALQHSRIYSRRTWDAVERKIMSTLGFTTSGKSRPMLIAHARRALADRAVVWRDEITLGEMSTFVIDESGREDHLEGCNDDGLFAKMLALEGAEVLAAESGEADEAAATTTGRDAWVWDKMREVRDRVGFRRPELDEWN